MKTIEQELKQVKPFKSEKQRALVNLFFTSNRLIEQMNTFFKSYGVSQKQYNVLRIIKGATENVSTCYIKERLIEKNADSSRIVERLIKKNLVQKCKNTKDARLISITITKEGKDLLKKIAQQNQNFTSPLQKLNDKECKQLNKLLNKIRN